MKNQKLTGLAQGGAKFQLQMMVNENTSTINKALLESLKKTGFSVTKKTKVQWLSPHVANEFYCFRGREFLEPMGLKDEKYMDLIWPLKGISWDGIALVSQSRKEDAVIFVSANSTLKDFRQPIRMPKSLLEKERAEFWLKETRYSLTGNSVESGVRWHESKNKSIAVKLGFVHFMRKVLNRDAFLFELCFPNDKSVKSPSSKSLFNGGIRDIEGEFDLPDGCILSDCLPPIKTRKTPENKCLLESVMPICHQVTSPVKERALIADHPKWGRVRVVEDHEFLIGTTRLPVKCNVYWVSRIELNQIKTALLLDKLGSKGIANKMKALIDQWKKIMRIPKELRGEYRRFPGENPCISKLEDIQKMMKSSKPQEEYCCGLLEDWDHIQDKCQKISGEYLEFGLEEIPDLPIYKFLRPGFFLPRACKSEDLPPGCYIDRRYAGEKSLLYHELAHAAMAVHRKKGAVVGCRWMEEGFAEYLQYNETGLSFGRGDSELDVYKVWKYFKQQNNDIIEKHLEDWLNHGQPGAHCELVKLMRDDVRKNWY